jgi:hypothetical protein
MDEPMQHLSPLKRPYDEIQNVKVGGVRETQPYY